MLPSQQELSELLDILYDAAADPSLWDLFLGRLAAHSEATSAALVVRNKERAVFGVSGSWKLDPEGARLYEQHYHAYDVWAEKLAGEQDCNAYIAEGLCPLAELRATEFYNDLLRKVGIEHAMFAIPENSKSSLASVSLYRDKSREEFQESDLEILRFLTPHLRRAFKLHTSFSELRTHAEGVEAGLNTCATPVILLAPNGRIVFMNRSALGLIAEKDGLTAESTGLRAERTGESNLLTKSIDQATRISSSPGDLVGGTLLISRRCRPPLQVFVTPIRNSSFNTTGKVAVAVFISDPLRLPRPTSAILRARYGLTPAECRVALLLADGHAPKEIAGTIGVKVETVRSQLKSVFSKTAVTRQSELVRLVLSNSGI